MPEPHTIFEVTCRTIQGRFILRPSRKLNDLILGVIGRGMMRHPVKIYLFVVLSNHLHMIISAPDIKNLSLFMNFINANIAKEAGRLCQWKEKFWGRRYNAIPILDDKALLGRARYILSHGCKEDIVERPGDWAGINCIKALTEGARLKGTWIDRTGIYNSGKKGENLKEFEFIYEIPLTLLPCFDGVPEKEQRSLWRGLVRDIESEFSKSRGKNKKLNLRKNHIYSSQLERRPCPFCHASTKAIREFFREGYLHFISRYRQAYDRFRFGDPNALSLFPSNCFIPPPAYASFHSDQ